MTAIDVSKFKPLCPNCGATLIVDVSSTSCPAGHHVWPTPDFDAAWNEFASSDGGQQAERALYSALNKTDIAATPVVLRIP